MITGYAELACGLGDYAPRPAPQPSVGVLPLQLSPNGLGEGEEDGPGVGVHPQHLHTHRGSLEGPRSHPCLSSRCVTRSITCYYYYQQREWEKKKGDSTSQEGRGDGVPFEKSG